VSGAGAVNFNIPQPSMQPSKDGLDDAAGELPANVAAASEGETEWPVSVSPAMSGRGANGMFRSDLMSARMTFDSMLTDGNLTAATAPGTCSGKIFSTAEARKTAGARMIPAGNRMLAIFAQMASTAPESLRRNQEDEAVLIKMVLTALGDALMRQTQVKLAAGNGAEAALASVILAGADYLAAGTDAKRQQEAIQRLTNACTKVDSNAPLYDMPLIFSLDPPAMDATETAVAFLKADTHSKFSPWVASIVTEHATLISLLNKPLTLEYPLVDGTKFSTGQWKGKVVVVDFWLAACAPCVKVNAQIKNLYSLQHAKGLEAVGYGMDRQIQMTQDFINRNPVPWPQMFNADQPGVEFVAQTYGTMGAPAMILIDRKGIVRDIHAGADPELGTKISKLLAEAP
jgi:hypothetical protein